MKDEPTPWWNSRSFMEGIVTGAAWSLGAALMGYLIHLTLIRRK